MVENVADVIVKEAIDGTVKKPERSPRQASENPNSEVTTTQGPRSRHCVNMDRQADVTLYLIQCECGWKLNRYVRYDEGLGQAEKHLRKAIKKVAA